MHPNSRDDDQPFRHYTLRHRIEAWISQNVFDRVVYRVRRGLLKGMMRRGGLAWLPDYIVSEHDSQEVRFWKDLDLNDLVVYDVGAFHGLLALHFARKAKQVVCFEPNSRNVDRLQENIRLNDLTNVAIHQVGLGSSSQTCELVSSLLMPGGGSIEPQIVNQTRQGNVPTHVESIEVHALDELIAERQLPAPDFIKIDVEGVEAEVLKGAERTLIEQHPRLFLEMHGDTMREKKRKVAGIVELLTKYGYERIDHVETGTRISAANTAVAAEGHLYVKQDA